MDQPSDIQKILAERFKVLPAPVQRAIQSTEIQKYLRDLANDQKLHVDQWQVLENEVMLALFGFSPASQLQENIQKSLKIDAQAAETIANAISEKVFKPVREELERQLEHPDAKPQEVSGVESARQEILGAQQAQLQTPTAPATAPTPASAPPAVAPATPPAPPPVEKAKREPLSPTPPAASSSAQKKDAAADPYREQIS